MIGTLRKLQKLISKFPSKARAPHSPQHSTSKARAPHSPQHSDQQSQSSPQSPSTVPAKPGLPTAPQHSTSEARAPHIPQHSTSKARAPHSRTRKARAPTAPPPSAVPATRDHHRDCLPLSSTRRSSQPPGTITGTACLFPVPEEAPTHELTQFGCKLSNLYSFSVQKGERSQNLDGPFVYLYNSEFPHSGAARTFSTQCAVTVQ